MVLEESTTSVTGATEASTTTTVTERPSSPILHLPTEVEYLAAWSGPAQHPQPTATSVQKERSAPACDTVSFV
ncbi:hypothetical protein DPMN_090520 [Dreissena polymorpha]|uniref:Uncharacterized protein n=1 Tax=Dreissena polymorpha TaxID=45954 RepID=A0A9D4KYR7_DREPO|nr:hypothetical protein DPMN_090520 [Dreissena polymorpha]